MAKSVNIPDVGTVNFPDEMDDDAITSAIESDILPSVKAQRATEPSRAAQYGATALRRVQSHVAGLGRAVGQFGLAPEAAVKAFGANLAAMGAGGAPGESLPEVDPMGNQTGSPMPVAADDAAVYQRDALMGSARQASDAAETERQAVRASGVQYGKVWSSVEDANAAKQAEYDKALTTEAPGMARSSKKVSDAQGIMSTLGAIAEDPLSTFGSLAGSIPDMLVGMGAGSLVSKAVSLGLGPAAQAAALAARHETLLSAAKNPATFANANRLADEAAAQAYAKTIERGAVSVAGGTANAVEGAQSGYQTGQQVVDKLNERDPNTGQYAIGDDVLAKNSPRFAELIQRGEAPVRARQLLGAELGDQATAMAAPWTMAMGKLTGAAGAEGRLIAGTGRLPLSTTLRNVGKETAEEGLQNIGEDFAGHNSRAQFDPNEPAFDAGGSFAQGIVGGFGLGASMHGGGHVAAMSRPAPSVMLAGRSIASFSDAELRGYADSGVLTGGVKEKVEGEMTRRAGEKTTQGEIGATAAAPGADQIDAAVQRFASAAGIAEPGGQAPTTMPTMPEPGSPPAPATTTALANTASVIPATPVTQASVQQSLEQGHADTLAKSQAEQEQSNANAIVPPPQEAVTPGTPAGSTQPAGALDNLSNAADAQRRAGVRLVIPDHGSSATSGVSNLESARTANDTGLVAGRADLDRSLTAARQRGQALDVPDLQPIQDKSTFRRAHAFAEVMQSISGVKPLLYHDPRPSAADGFELNGVPYINAGNLDQSIQHTAFHETYHVAETRAERGDKSAQQFVATAQTIFDMIGPEGRLAYATKYLFKNQVEAGQMTPEQALAHPALRSEMVADFFGQRADDQAWMASLAKRAPEHFGGFVRRWIDTLSNAIAGLRGKRADYGHKDIDSMIRKLNHAKAVAVSALIEWHKSNPLLAGAVPKAGQTFDWRAERDLATRDMSAPGAAAQVDAIRHSKKQTDTPEFKRWFGDSKVVGTDGQPILFYHDGAESFTELQRGGGRFGGIFVREGRPAEYGRTTHVLYLRGPILELAEMREILAEPGGANVIRRAIGRRISDQQVDALIKALTDGSHYPTDKTALDALRAIDEADAQTEIQRLRGAVAVELGFGAVRTADEFEGGTVMVVKPDQIKSATGNRGTFDPTDPDIRHSSKQGEPWYSALERRLGAASMNSGPASGWKALVKGLVAKGDVKAAEVQWSGLDEWLDLQQGKVPKQAVLDYLAANGVKVTETKLGGTHEIKRMGADEFVLQTPHGKEQTYFKTEGEARAYAAKKNWAIGDGGVTKFNRPDLVLPGGTNYREVLLTLPPTRVDLPQWKVIRPDGQVDGTYISEDSAHAQAARRGDGYSVRSDESTVLDGGFRSSHWNEPNVLAHIRLNDRTDSTDARLLFVEEVQSDWGQEGKKKGFDNQRAAKAEIRNGQPGIVDQNAPF